MLIASRVRLLRAALRRASATCAAAVLAAGFALAEGLVAAAAFATAAQAAASESIENGEITGTIKDPTGQPAAGAVVSLLDAQQALIASARTDERGVFSLKNVANGSYLLRVEFPGFAARRRAVTLGPAGMDLTIVLEPARLVEQVT